MGARPGTILFHCEYVDLCGDILTALLLGQILYWYQPDAQGKPKLRAQKNGIYWLAKSHKEWYDELRMTRDQSRTCIDRLVNLGLIETKLFRFNGAPTLHLRLLQAGGGPLLKVAFQCNHGYIPVQPKSQCITETTTETTTEKKIFRDKSRRTTRDDSKKKVDEGDKEVDNGKVGKGEDMNKAEITDSQSALVYLKEVAAKKPPKKVGGQYLASCWEQLLPKHHDVGFVKPLTMKEKGVLGQYAKLTKEQAVPAMEWALAHWSTFRMKVQTQKEGKVPTQPTVYALLQYCDVAVNAVNAGLKKESWPKGTGPLNTKPVQLPSQPKELADEDKPLSVDEMLAMLEAAEQELAQG